MAAASAKFPSKRLPDGDKRGGDATSQRRGVSDRGGRCRARRAARTSRGGGRFEAGTSRRPRRRSRVACRRTRAARRSRRTRPRSRPGAWPVGVAVRVARRHPRPGGELGDRRVQTKDVDERVGDLLVLPTADQVRQRRGRDDAGRHGDGDLDSPCDPGDAKAFTARRLERSGHTRVVHRLPDADPGVRYWRSAAAAAAQRRRDQRQAARVGPTPVADAAALLWARAADRGGLRVPVPSRPHGRRRRRRHARVDRAFPGAPICAERTPDQLRGRGRHRGGKGGAQRDRRLPARARTLSPARRAHSQRCPADRSAGHGQDAPGPGRGRRSGRARSSGCRRQSSSR